MQKSALMLACLAGLVVVASAASVAQDEFSEEADSALALIPDDNKEIGSLNGNMSIFSDFCLTARDQVRKYLKDSTNSAAARILTIMLSTVEEIGQETLSVQEDAVKEGAKLIAEHGVGPMNAKIESREKIAAELEQRIKNTQNFGLLATVKDAVKQVFMTVLHAASTETAKRLALLKSNFSGENVKQRIEEACADISYNLQRILSKSLADAKRDLAASSDPSMKEVIARTQLKNIGCITVGRVVMVDRFCKLLNAAQDMIYPILGI